jgi:hypothetical protein
MHYSMTSKRSLSISLDQSNFSKQSLQYLFSKGSIFIRRKDVSKILYDMICLGEWDHLTYKNRCIKEVLKHGPRLGNEDCKNPCTGVEEQCGSSKIDRNNQSTSPTSG